MSRKPRVRNGGKKCFHSTGFYVEGRHFGDIDHACTFAGNLMRQYNRAVDVVTVLSTGHAMQYFRYVPADSFESEAAQPTKDGHVIICSGRRYV